MQERITTAGIFIDKGMVLVAKRPEGGVLGGKWEFPGGKNRWAESVEDTLKREWKEELDADIQTGKELFSFDFANKDVLYHLVCLEVSVPDGYFKPLFHTSLDMADRKVLASLDMGSSDDRIRRFLLESDYL